MKNRKSDLQNNLAIIPARGGSKGIPRKNLRPIAGFPMIYYSIRAALQSTMISRVVVSTDDDEIALFAERFGADVVMRHPSLADDKTTLDPVIIDATTMCEHKYAETYDAIVTIQPTSPLVRSADIDAAIERLVEESLDTVLSVVDDRHLCWRIKDGRPVPAYNERVNRQGLPPNYRETGAVIVCSRDQLDFGSRIGNSIGIHEIPHEYSFDIDTFSDLYVCEALLSRKKIVFTVIGYAEVGLGHAYRAIMFAHELVQYELVFICEASSDLAIEYIRSNNYSVVVAEDGQLAKAVIAERPALVVNDILDTEVQYMETLATAGIVAINFEDMGPGHRLAALVVNALYPNQQAGDNVLVGPEYFCLRDEFLYLGNSLVDNSIDNVSRVLITFGGVDEGDLTAKVLLEIAPLCIKNNITVEVVVGPGYAYKDRLLSLVAKLAPLVCTVISQTKRISDCMGRAHVGITSAGRTVLELAAMKVPMLVVCQNARETTHSFASWENGIINLGHRSEVSEGKIAEEFQRLVVDTDLRKAAREKMNKLDLKNGKSRVIEKIKSFVK